MSPPRLPSPSHGGHDEVFTVCCVGFDDSWCIGSLRRISVFTTPFSFLICCHIRSMSQQATHRVTLGSFNYRIAHVNPINRITINGSVTPKSFDDAVSGLPYTFFAVGHAGALAVARTGSPVQHSLHSTSSEPARIWFPVPNVKGRDAPQVFR